MSISTKYVQIVLEMEDVRANKEWICPHCTEEKGINPYWICNRYVMVYKTGLAARLVKLF